MNIIRTLQRASLVVWNEMNRHKANQGILKKRLQAAVRQTEQASRHRLTSTASTITDASKTIATVSRTQMLMDQLLSKTATTNGGHDIRLPIFWKKRETTEFLCLYFISFIM
jgi:hypothetical protein